MTDNKSEREREITKTDFTEWDKEIPSVFKRGRCEL